jgi:hypothetical protein
VVVERTPAATEITAMVTTCIESVVQEVSSPLPIHTRVLSSDVVPVLSPVALSILWVSQEAGLLDRSAEEGRVRPTIEPRSDADKPRQALPDDFLEPTLEDEDGPTVPALPPQVRYEILQEAVSEPEPQQ